MRYIILLALASLAIGCGSEAVLNTVETTTHKLKPVLKGWRKLCKTSRGCLEAAGEDTAEVIKICESRWSIFQAIQLIQETTIRAAGGEPCTQSSCSQ